MRDQYGTATVPLWPPKYTPDTKGDEIRVRDGGGETVARVRERTTLGGGDVSKSTVKDDGLVDGRTGRELFERCPGE